MSAQPAARTTTPAKPIWELGCVYGAIGEWFLYPEEIDPGSFGEERASEVLAAARIVGNGVEDSLRSFLDRHDEVDAEHWLNLFELSPRCPLYLGTHQFEEPKTCSAAGVSDRNTYMLEIKNIYRHFSIELNGELPDYLPAMIEFLSITAGCSPLEDEVRVRLIDKLMVDGARIVADKLDPGEVPHRHLVDALIGCLEVELDAREPEEELDLVRAAADGTAPVMIQIEEVPGA